MTLLEAPKEILGVDNAHCSCGTILRARSCCAATGVTLRSCSWALPQRLLMDISVISQYISVYLSISQNSAYFSVFLRIQHISQYFSVFLSYISVILQSRSLAPVEAHCSYNEEPRTVSVAGVL